MTRRRSQADLEARARKRLASYVAKLDVLLAAAAKRAHGPKAVPREPTRPEGNVAPARGSDGGES